MRLLTPLAPAWLVGLWLLVTSESLWLPRAPEVDLPQGELAGGWVLAGALVAATLAYRFAPVLGRNLAVSTNSSALAGLGASSSAQRAFGCTLVRGVTLLVLYLLVVGFVALELRATA